MRRIAIVLTLTTSTLMSGVSVAQQQFDGHWGVEAIPETGTCKKAHRYPLVIGNGTVRYGGARKLNAEGRVQASGHIQGRIQGRKSRVDVTGNLAERSCSGTWTISGRINCSGRWNAEKRG